MNDVTSRMISAERAPAALLSWCLMVAIPFTASASASDGVLAQIELAGTELILHTEQGVRLAGQDLVGAEIDLPGLGTMRVDGASLDESSRFGDIWLYQLQARMPGGNAFEQVCEPDGEGDTRAVLFPGDFDERMRYRADTTTFSLSCVSGVQAKCLRWGYQPWRTAPLTGEPLTRHFDACIRLARADYCGDDQPSTRDDTMIDIYDLIGVQEPEYNPGALEFEAGWAENGAVCIHHTRIPENLDLATLSLQCPRLTDAAMGLECDEITAMAEGALLFNRSVAKRQP